MEGLERSKKESRRLLPGKEVEERRLVWWNCAGGLASKINFVKKFVNDCSPDLFFVSESNIKTEKVFSHLNIFGYDLVTSGTKFARISCYIKIGSPYKLVSQGQGSEIITLESKDAIVIGVYRPFKVEAEMNIGLQFDLMLSHLDTRLNELSKDKEVILAGDFNLDFQRVGDSSYAFAKMLNKLGIWAAKWGLAQRIEELTRRRAITTAGGETRVEESIIDHLYSTEERQPVLQDLGTSDHLAIVLTIHAEINEIYVNKKSFRRDWRKYTKLALEKVMTYKAEQINSHIPRLQDPDVANEVLNEYLLEILDMLAPKRAFRMRNDKQIFNSEVEALKKRRNRKYILFKKTGNPGYLKTAQKLSKDLKALLQKVELQTVQKKAESKDTRMFWNTVKELRHGRQKRQDLEIKMPDGSLTSDSATIANHFGKFFQDKVTDLTNKTEPEKIKPPEWGNERIEITMVEIGLVGRTLNSKKSAGLDDIPMCLVKDTEPFIRQAYCHLFNLASTHGIPEAWKMAKVVPLHKKGDKDLPANYRPISNLSSVGKFFEKIILKKINDEGMHDGDHQHGFRKFHSTTTAILDLQRILAQELDSKRECMVYSVDLSAAFDLLRKDTLNEIIKDTISAGLRRVIYDFLSNRKCVVEVNGVLSKEFDIDLGCVQGSVLGPKLFNLYTKNIPNHLSNDAQITTYADDSYVVISAPETSSNIEHLENLTKECLDSHVAYLKSLGMVVNQSKTEYIHISRHPKQQSYTLPVLETMKVLGVLLDNRMTWSEHIAMRINKLNGLTGALKFIRKRLTQEQFLQVLTAQYYSVCYYASPAWLGWHTRKMDIRKLNSVHYRLLRTALGDWRQTIGRDHLDALGRVRPTLWAKYITASTVVKILRDDQPARLSDHIQDTIYSEERTMRVKFYDKSKLKPGQQAIGNRIKHIFDEIYSTITFNESNDSLRVLLKRELGFPKTKTDISVCQQVLETVRSRGKTRLNPCEDSGQVKVTSDAKEHVSEIQL